MAIMVGNTHGARDDLVKTRMHCRVAKQLPLTPKFLVCSEKKKSTLTISKYPLLLITATMPCSRSFERILQV